MGIQVSVMVWCGFYEGMTDPHMVLDIPQAISHRSMHYWTSPIHSGITFPTSRQMIYASISFLHLIASPIILTTSPLHGMGVSHQAFLQLIID